MRQSEAKKYGKFNRSTHTSSTMEPQDSRPTPNTTAKSGTSLLSADMKREQERLDWEQQALEEMDEANRHYSKKGEIRTLGTGFYQFSQDDQERKEQMQQLNQLRDTTMNERKETLKMKESKKNARELRKQMLVEKKMQKKAGASEVKGFTLSNTTTETENQVQEFFNSIT